MDIGDYVWRHNIYVASEWAYPDASCHTFFLEAAHVDGAFHFNHTNRTENSYIGHTLYLSGGSKQIFQPAFDL